jgi:hypothetical protein
MKTAIVEPNLLLPAGKRHEKPERLFIVDLSLARRFDEWLACRAEGERLWLEIKHYIAEEGHVRAMVRYILAEKGIKQSALATLFDPQPRKKSWKQSLPIYHVEKGLINAAKFALQKHGISSRDFEAIAHRAFKRAANSDTLNSTNNQKLT